ncbi:MAG: hypothetical protein CO094_08305 [Anaerolineae bacterium CG_4_9_14_3_um_filter_57_17]|nr:hypothetical protein [bacterium]NCT20039.1 hypothetical protein [bacterium]OIO86275.1 MAG: hypothetical protein AUK01_03835 [Anaerolineae bacterium CG2_30_57_67]PJB66039.1 MAG: hypothetical protein CO094_08305 [Anaerolineae bacterium CG_4_9_14_3_um_filter_57_17]
MTEETRTYRPELLPRQGEINAWGLALLASLGMAALVWRGQIPSWTWFFIAFLYFSAASISLGNWVDRHTRLTLSAQGILFENGLRKVSLAWEALPQVRVLPARWGKTVQLMAASGHCEFSTLGEVQFRGELRGRTGFSQGEAILREILASAGLTRRELQGEIVVYSREA